MGCEQLNPQRGHRRAGADAQFAAKRPLQPFQLAQRGSSIATVSQLPGTGEAGFLVGRVGHGELGPAAGSPKQFLMKLPQPVAWSFQPRLLQVVREELAGPLVSSGCPG